jgi:D-xylonolactonase
VCIEVKVALDLRCALGEGLHWDRRRNLLWFVDIYGPHVFWFNPNTQESGRRVLPESVGWVLSIENSDRVLVGLRSGIALLDAFDESAQIEWLDRRFPSDSDHRLNDAKADRRGRLWYGSVNASDESKAVGCLARHELRGERPVIVDSGYKVTNGPAFVGDCTFMLHSDSLQRITYRYDIDVETGLVANRTIWRRFAEDEGSPDGMIFDADGCVWIAHWGVGKLCRYDIRGNRVLTIQMPVTNVTNVCFGGREMTRMFVTSASLGLDDAKKNSEGSAGALFEVSGVGVCGLPSWQLRI